jgi:predicted DNA-binding protein (UPF0278 family)
MEQLRKLFVEDGCQQMELPVKPEIEDSYLFCKTDIIDGEAVLRWEEHMTPGAMSARLRTLGEIHGWLHSFFSHRFRYGGGKMLNGNDSVSEAQQNLIMKHASISTFLNHYLPRHIDTDMQNVMNGRASNKKLMRAITRMSRWIDKRRPRHLTAEQRASLREHLEYVEATRRLNEHRELCQHDASDQMLARLDKLTRERANTFGRLERVLRKKTRMEFDRKQAKKDIERQLSTRHFSGTVVGDDESKAVPQTQDQMLPERIYLLEKLFTLPTSHSFEVELQRRNDAVAAISQYCPILEGGPLRGRRKRAAPSDGFDEEQTNVLPEPAKNRCSSPEPLQQDILLVKAENYIKKAKKPRRCFQCHGNTQLPIHRRTQKYSEYKSTLRHFREKHLRDRRCHMCDKDLLHEMHLRRHAEEVHRLSTERNYYAKEDTGSDIDTD